MRNKSVSHVRFLSLLLLLALLVTLFGGCAKVEQPAQTEAASEPTEETGWVMETNEGKSATSYPYVIRTASANWYLSAADMELLGEDAYRAGLDETMSLAEPDFADARQALSEYLQGPVPAIDIYTDFSGRSEDAQRDFYGAYFYGDDRGIRLFHSWEIARQSLLHEYVHYLSFVCCDLGLKPGFWAEAVAEYISLFVCENRTAASVNYGLGEESLAEMTQRGLLDPLTGEISPYRLYCGYAELLHRDYTVGANYLCVSGNPMTLTESQQQSPLITALSYYEAACFFSYLLDRYGASLVFAHLDCEQRDFEEVYGKDFQTLFLEWVEVNRKQCEEMGLDLPEA